MSAQQDYGRDLLNLSARVPRTKAEGPGTRFAIWVQGCPMRCPGCCNPGLLEFREATLTSVDELADEILATTDIEGVTYIGGEPFSQAAALANLSQRIRPHGLSTMSFSGHTLRQLRSSQRQDWEALLAELDLLVDGPYIERLRQNDRRWIGSSNQQIHFLSDRYADLQQEWDAGSNTIEIHVVNGRIEVNGFPDDDLIAALQSL
jgi:anaerobic ribonucleoside-triphosphate reductase activating protein